MSPNYLRGGYGGNLAYIDPPLEQLIKDSFESFQKFQEEFKAKTEEVEGSGWGWLAYNQKMKVLEIITTSNHDSPLDVFTSNYT